MLSDLQQAKSQGDLIVCHSLAFITFLCTYQYQAGGGGEAEGRDLINRFGQGVEHLNYLAVLGGRVFEFLLVPVPSPSVLVNIGGYIG